MLPALLTTAALAPCAHADTGPPLTVRFVGHRKVVACDRRSGRPVVVRRARAPRSLLDAHAAGRRVAWVAWRRGRPSVVGVSGVRRDGRTAVLSRRRVRGATEVALTTRGDLAWIAHGRVVVDSPRERPRIVAGGVESGLAVEDGRTLRWHGDDGYAYRDLHPWPPGACPQRRRFRLLARTERVVVTEASYRTGPDEWRSTVRICALPGATDRVVARGDGSFGGWTYHRVAAISGSWVLLAETIGARYGCARTFLPILATTGQRGRRASVSCQDMRPDPETPVVTDRGIPVWIERDDTRSALLAASGGFPDPDIDSGDADAIQNLRVEGSAVRWTNEGVERTAVPD